jgi:hypothetical protein
MMYFRYASLLILCALSLVGKISATTNHACAEWILGFSGESCSETCAHESKYCVLQHIKDVTTIDSFSSMVNQARQLGADNLPDIQEFCSGGINTWTYATAPAVTTFHIYEKNSEEPEKGGKSKSQFNCFFPEKIEGDCDTKFTVPSAQRFCSCQSFDCIKRKNLRGKVLAKL